MVKNPFSDFELQTTNGNFKFSEQRGHPLVIYFYPKDNTPGCTSQGQQYRDLYPEFEKLKCPVVGISRDSLASHGRFKSNMGFPFELACDADEIACKLFNVIKKKTMYGREVRGIERSAFVFDRNGELRREWRGVKVPGHAQEVLDFVKTLA